jgi:hypothetical protein
MSDAPDKPAGNVPDPGWADPKSVRIERDPKGRLTLRREGDAAPVAGVRVARCFPWSMPGRYVSLRDADGKEICLLRSLDTADPRTRRIIEEELNVQEFIPKITAIDRVCDNFGLMVWDVHTDRGPVELQVQHAEDVRQLDDGRVLIRDYAGGVFEVADAAALDPHSRMLLEQHLA